MSDNKNNYDKTDKVRQLAMIRGGGLKLAEYQVRDPETGEWSGSQFHMTYGDTVMCVMGEYSARLFAKFISDRLPEPDDAGNENAAEGDEGESA